MSIAKLAVYLSLSGLLALASACSGPRRPRLDGSIDQDSAVEPTCQFGTSDGGPCNGATQVEVDFCDRTWVEVTPDPGILNQDVSVRARAKDLDLNGLNVTWTADPDGTFADADAVVTTFHCDTLGRKTLHMVSVDNRGCDSEVRVEMNCVAATTGKQSSSRDGGSL